MKEYKYNGDLNEDIKKSKQKFDIKTFLTYICISLGSVGLTWGICYLIFHSVSVGALAGWFTGYSICNVFKTINESKKSAKKYQMKTTELYEDINLNYSNRALSMKRMKECISLQKSEKIIKDYNSNNISLTDEEKIVTYFYLLDPQEQIQVLRQVKDEVNNWESTIYLLEEEDIKRENIEIPVERTLRLKK